MPGDHSEVQRPVGDTRRDPTGKLTFALGTLIEEGERLRESLDLHDGAGEQAIELESQAIERWRVQCLHILAGGFEREAVQEFVRATARSGAYARAGALARLHRCRVENALALLLALKATLDAPGVVGRRGGAHRTHALAGEPHA